MLSFVISTLTFSLAAYVLNRHFDARETGHTQSRKIAVMALATVVSIAAGWVVDKVNEDGAPQPKSASVTEVIQSGDPVQILKMLAGFN